MSLPLLLRFYSIFRTRFSAVSPCTSERIYIYIFFCNPFVFFSLDAVCVGSRSPSKCARGPQTVDDAYNRDKHNGPDDRGYRFPRNERGLSFAMSARRKISPPSSRVPAFFTRRVIVYRPCSKS